MKSISNSFKIVIKIVSVFIVVVIVMNVLCALSKKDNPYLAKSPCKFMGVSVLWCKGGYVTRGKGIFPKCELNLFETINKSYQNSASETINDAPTISPGCFNVEGGTILCAVGYHGCRDNNGCLTCCKD